MATYPIDGGAEVAVQCHTGIGKAPVVLNVQVKNIHGMMGINSGGFGGRLHWAVLSPDGQWQPPTMQPDGSCECDAVASSARLNKDGNCSMRFPHGHVPERIVFVPVIQVHGQTHWLKTGGQDFIVNLRELAGDAAFSGGANERVAERPAEWPALEQAKASVAKASASESAPEVTAKPRRRRPQPEQAVAAPVTGSAVKEGGSGLEGGLGSLSWTVVRGKDTVFVFLEASMELCEEAQVYLHWGTAGAAGGQWELPKEAIPGTNPFDAMASRTLFQGQARAELRFRAAVAPQWIGFVVFVMQGSSEMWVKSDHGSDFWLDVLASPDASAVPSAPKGKPETVAQRICAAETRHPHWTQFNRLCLANEILSGTVGVEEAAWLATDLCLASVKVLEWYRKSGYQPKDMAHAQERIGGNMAAAHSKATDAIVRTLLRLCVRAVPRGNSGGGDAIRHGILNIMRTHGIKEGHRPGIECKFIEQWHQKLHTNSAPDDIAICSGYLAFLSSGNPDDMWRVIYEMAGITREDLGKMCQTGFADHTKSGAKGLNFTPVHLPHMYNDMQAYLGLLKHVHGGSDLFSLCEACKGQYPDHGAECLAFEIHDRRDDPMAMGRILDMRRALEPCLGKRDILMLDVAMEDQFRSLAERSNVGAMGNDDVLNFVTILLEDLLMSRKFNASLQQGYAFLHRLIHGDHGGLQRWSPEWCKMVHAACDRIALVCAGTADTVVELLQGCADQLQEAGQKPGAVFQPDSKALATFGEEKARCLTERLVAQTFKTLMPQLRRGAGLGPWEVVSQGDNGKAFGKVEVMKELNPELKATTNLVAVVETMTGWEDIPAGITALLLPASQAVDTLSHVAIRARNQQVLLASCDDDSLLQQLKAANGKFVQVELTANGVTWSESSATNGKAVGAAAAPKSVMQKITPPPAPPAVVIAATDFVKNKKSLGGKSLHLAELKPDKGSYTVPASATVPYGMFEKMLKEPVNEGIKEELDEILATGDLAEARKFIVDYLAVSEDIEKSLNKTLAAAGTPALSGDWQRALKGVWASKWTDRAVSSRKQMSVPDDILFLAVLVQPIAPAAYAFVIHTKSPLPSAAKDEQLIELCVGLGESLVSNSPGRALSASVGPTGQSTVHVFPSKPDGVFTPEGGTLIFRSDSNGEDLEGFAGAGLYDSITVTACTHRSISYADEPLMFDASFREGLLRKLYDLGRRVEANFAGAPQDIEGAVLSDGSLVVTQSRPQV